MTVPEPSFSAPVQTMTCHGLLFDMDGTIIDSTAAVIKHWHKIANEIGVDPEVILATSHGRRSIDVLQLYAPELANWDYVSHVEGLLPREFAADAVEIPGSRALLEQLEGKSVPWLIVTSGTRALVSGWLDVLELSHPKDLVVAESVKMGKPDPTCYQLGRTKLELRHSDPWMIVFEDAPAGVRAGKAAGFKVVALSTTHSVQQLKDSGADVIVRDLRSVTLKAWDSATGEAQVEIADALV